MKRLQFEPEMLTKKPATGLDVDTLLSHFAIITYLVGDNFYWITCNTDNNMLFVGLLHVSLS